MISLFSLDQGPKTIRKTLVHDDQAFIKARDFYQRNIDMRHHKILVYDKNRKPVYCMGWMKNKLVNIFRNKDTSQTHLSNFWDYSLTEEGLDYTYVDRYDLIIYEELEEYSYHTARMAQIHNHDLKLAFTDRKAAFFFEESDRLFISDSEEDLFRDHPELRELKTLRAKAELRWDPQGVFTDHVPSFEIMTSMYWIRREASYGPLNPDKTFYLIKQMVKENGITAIISNVIGVTQMIRRIRPDFIPVVDLSSDHDPNQFAGTSGEDVWSMFFKQLSPYSLEEVYNSRHVIVDQNSNINMNPYLTEFLFSNQRAELHYGHDLQYKEEIEDHTGAELDKLFPGEKKRILAVVVRETDYLLPYLAPFVPHGITARETLDQAISYVEEKDFDYVYLATEDSSVLEMFLASQLKDRLLYVDQKRIDYRREEYRGKMLVEIFRDDPRDDPYERTLQYITVLEGLVRCQALLANVSCGAVTYALGRKDDFEFVKVHKIDNFQQ